MSESLKDLDHLAGRVRLHRQDRSNPILIVEGPSDERLLREALGDAIDFFPAGSRSRAVSAIRQLYEWSMGSVACVVDRDFDDVIEECESAGLPVVAYLNADQESMLLDSDLGDRLLEEYASAGKLEAWGGVGELRASILEVVVPVARVRGASARHGWGISFAAGLTKYVDKRTLTLDKPRYAQRLDRDASASPGLGAILDVLQGRGELGRDPVCPRCRRSLFRGRDFLEVLAIALRSAVGSHRGSVDPEPIEKALRLAGSRELAAHYWLEDVRGSLRATGVGDPAARGRRSP